MMMVSICSCHSFLNDISSTYHLRNAETMVGLEKTFYNVTEDVGVVEVCAIVYSPTIDCPINFTFDISLSARDGSAGIVMKLYL